MNVSFFGEGAEFDHVGIAVRSIDSIAHIQADKIIDPIQKVSIVFLTINDLKVELLEPLNEESPVHGILQRGQNLYHIAYRVDNLQNSIARAKEYSFRCISAPAEAPAFDNRQIVWLFSRIFGLFEIIQK